MASKGQIYGGNAPAGNDGALAEAPWQSAPTVAEKRRMYGQASGGNTSGNGCAAIGGKGAQGTGKVAAGSLRKGGDDANQKKALLEEIFGATPAASHQKGKGPSWTGKDNWSWQHGGGGKAQEGAKQHWPAWHASGGKTANGGSSQPWSIATATAQSAESRDWSGGNDWASKKKAWSQSGDLNGGAAAKGSEPPAKKQCWSWSSSGTGWSN